MVELGPPPDLPSLLLKNRIIYVGSPLVTAVSELVVAQLLYLNFRDNEMITLYINSPGSSVQREYTTRDTDAFAIADTMMFIKAPIRTVCVGKAYGTAAMLLSLGQKGCRYCLPNASIMLNQPRSYTQGQATDIAIQAKEVLKNREYTVELLSKVKCVKRLMFLNLSPIISEIVAGVGLCKRSPRDILIVKSSHLFQWQGGFRARNH